MPDTIGEVSTGYFTEQELDELMVAVPDEKKDAVLKMIELVPTLDEKEFGILMLGMAL